MTPDKDNKDIAKRTVSGVEYTMLKDDFVMTLQRDDFTTLTDWTKLRAQIPQIPSLYARMGHLKLRLDNKPVVAVFHIIGGDSKKVSNDPMLFKGVQDFFTKRAAEGILLSNKLTGMDTMLMVSHNAPKWMITELEQQFKLKFTDFIYREKETTEEALKSFLE